LALLFEDEFALVVVILVLSSPTVLSSLYFRELTAMTGMGKQAARSDSRREEEVR
jgi:hypothetical protein